MKKLINKIVSFAMAVILVLGIMPLTAVAEEQSGTDIDEVLSNMTQNEKYGQLIMPDFRHWIVEGEQIPLTEMNDEVGKVIADYKLGGVILFRENVANTEQTTRLTDGLQKAVSNDIPLMLTIDQEGGLVTRLQTGTNMPGNMALGAARDLALTREVSKAIGEEVHSLGLNINFAPSVDVNSNYLNPVIGIRSFGSDTTLVSDMGVAYIKGLQDAKVAGAAKHFPGHGDTATDSHFGLPVVDKSLEEFKATDLKPFEAAVEAGVDMLMTAHIVVPALDDTKIIAKDGKEMGTPATLSKPILPDLVRDEMEYDGIVITDALNMKAISDNFTEAETVVKTIAAGADIALMPTFIRKPSDVTKLDEIYEALNQAVEDGVISQTQIDKSVHRVLTLKKNREIIDNKDTRTVEERIEAAKKIVGSQTHKEIERRAAEKAVTLIKNENQTLPLQLEDNTSIQILSSWGTRANLMELQMKNIIAKNGMKNVEINQHIFVPGEAVTTEDKTRIDSADYIIMETMNLGSKSIHAPEVVKYANETDANLAVMSTRNPYDIMFMEDVKANIAVYGSSGYDQTQQGEAALPINIPVGMDVIFGEAKPGGKLPVSIPKADGTGNLYEFGHGLSYKDEEPKKQGWVKDGSDWYYYDEDHNMQTGWLEVGNAWYYMSSTGVMQTGWNKVQHTWYYMSPSGAMQTGWNKVGNTWYYMNPSGAMQTGWNKVGNTWYYMSSTGVMQKGWNKVQHTWYYMSPSGAMQTGWNKVGNTWYYMSSSGAMQTGWNKIGNTWYYMSPSGAMQTGWNKVGNTWYYMSPSGAMQTGWLKLGNHWYYLNNNGSMQTQNTTINGRWYRFNTSGRML